MRRREFLKRAGAGAAGLGVLRTLPGCRTTRSESGATTSPLAALRERYFLRTLVLNPVLSTYLGGDGYAPSLRPLNGALRDFRPEAIADEVLWLKSVAAELSLLAGAALPVEERIDHGVMSAQIAFLLHMLEERRYQERAVDTYTNEPFRGVDWQLQQMTPQGRGLGSALEWDDVVARVAAVPAYLRAAEQQLRAGIAAHNTPDHRLLANDGIKAAADAAGYFATELPALAARHVEGRPLARALAQRLDRAGRDATTAFAGFRTFLAESFTDASDRFAAGEEEYRWRLRTCLLETRTPADLFEYGAAEIARYREQLFAVAAEIAAQAKLPLSFATDDDRRAAVRAVMSHLERDAPKDDDELFRWYRACTERSVAWGRQRAMFDVPADYRLDLQATPPILRGTGGASYYPAPTFKSSGVGRFYLDPTDNDPAQLAANHRATIADTTIHEGFPGHDWHYQFMAQHAHAISNVRWLSVGSVEDSFSMWADSMAAEGWALYAEELMAEPTPGRPHGFYDAAEHLVELQWQIIRAVRVRVDVGIHTGRMSFDEAVDELAAEGSFYPGARAHADDDPAARAILENATDQVFRYSKWPTQAITYNLGQAAIVSLRAAEQAKLGARFSAKDFHERFMKMGTIPAGYFRDAFLQSKI